MAMGFLKRSLVADFGIEVGTLVRGAVQEIVLRLLSSTSFCPTQRTGTTETRPREVAVGAGQRAFQRSNSTVEAVNTALNMADALRKPVPAEHNDESPFEEHGL
eukprot:4540330-Amphidinium_carterae.2